MHVLLLIYFKYSGVPNPFIEDEEDEEEELPPKHPASTNVDSNIIMIENFFICIPINNLIINTI